MVKLTHIWRVVAAGAADEELLVAQVAESREKQAEGALAAKQRDDDHARAQKKEREDREWFFFQLILASDFQRSLEEFRNDLADLRKVTEGAYTRALEKEQAAIVAFDAIRERAVVLDDGQRAYFARDGHALYREDGHPITDRTIITKALQRRSDGAPTFEDFLESRTKRVEAARNVEQLGTALNRLDDLDRRVKSGQLSPDDLTAAQKETADVVRSLPDEAREEYERLHAARAKGKLSYAPADPESDSAGPRGEDLQRTGAVAASTTSEQSAAPVRRSPVYRQADF